MLALRAGGISVVEVISCPEIFIGAHQRRKDKFDLKLLQRIVPTYGIIYEMYALFNRQKNKTYIP